MILTLTLAFLILPLFTYLMGRWEKNRAAYHEGFRDGCNDERSRTNAKMIPAQMEACRRGILAERNRAANAQN